jgi:hypothetical protein
VPSLLISYGTAERQPAGPAVTIDTASGEPLRLNNAPYTYDDGIQGPGASAEERLAFLRDHLTDLCDLWAKRPRQFVSLYFRFIERVMQRDRAAIEAKTRRLGGLFTPADFAFSALRPLPRAHIEGIRVDFAFWTGTALIAVDIAGDDARGAAWEQRRAALTAARILPLELAANAIACDDPAQLDEALPREFTDFWRSERLPSSPFKASGLGAVSADAPDF